MSAPRHTAATRRIQASLERLELQHLREFAAEQQQRIDQLLDESASLLSRLHDAEDMLDWQWQRTMEMGQRMEAEGTGRLGLSRDGALCVLVNAPQPALAS